MRSRRHTLAVGLATAYSLALLGDQMLYVFLPSHPAAAVRPARAGLRPWRRAGGAAGMNVLAHAMPARAHR